MGHFLLLSPIKYRRTLTSLPITLQRPECLRKSTDNNKPFISGPPSHYTLSCSPVPIRFAKRFPYSTFHESTAKSANLCQFLLYSAERFPLPSMGSTRLLWFLTGVTWKCTVGTHYLFHSQIQVSLGYRPHLLGNRPAKLKLKQVCD